MSVNTIETQEKPIFPTFGAIFAPAPGAVSQYPCNNPALNLKNAGQQRIIPQDSTEKRVIECTT